MNNNSFVSQKEYISRINNVIDYIDGHIDEKINLEKLSQIAYFSPFHFHRLFCAILNETPLDYLNRTRLQKAANILVMNPGLSITETAYNCGFQSPAAFSRSFKNYFDISPKEYRILGFNQTNSKNCKVNSKNWKEDRLSDNYFEDVNNSFSNNNQRYTMEVKIQEMPKLTVAYVANYEGYIPAKINIAWEKLCKWAGANNLINKDSKFLGISFDNPDVTAVEKCRYYACITIPKDLELPKEIGKLELQEGKYAVLHFEGKDNEMQKAYKELYSVWLPNSGYQPTESPCYEIYISTPEQNEKQIFIMDIYMPIKPL